MRQGPPLLYGELASWFHLLTPPETDLSPVGEVFLVRKPGA